MKIEHFNNVVKQLKNADKIYIYGAGDVAKEVYFCLSHEPYNFKIEAFYVTKISESTPSEIGGVKVVVFKRENICDNSIVIVSVLEKFRDEISAILEVNEIKNRIFLTFESDLWSKFRSALFEKHCLQMKYPYLFFKENGQNIASGDYDVEDCKVYVTRSTKDKPLKQTFERRKWEYEILAGAALDNVNSSYVRDDKGENISLKNRKYCELTALYWMWKNTNDDYVGLSHYRRRFSFQSDDLKMLCSGDIDVILTTPVINVPSVQYMYGKNHDIHDWNVMKNVIGKMCPEYVTDFSVVGNSNYYIPYNMFIMKKMIFKEYCGWIFPVLEECERVIGDKDDAYQNRYIGFLAERLMTMFFYHNRNNYHIMFSNKHFLE